jgi:hypothetical protein
MNHFESLLMQTSLRNLRELDCDANRPPVRSKTLQARGASMVAERG